MPEENISFWPTDKDRICAQIRSRRSPFKVLMKTRNEDILLRPWLEHYTRFMPPEDIIIADNMSTEPRVLDLYKSEKCVVFQYESTKDGLHNYIHNRTNFPELYMALEASCTHYTFVDNDEFLVLADRKTWSVGRWDFLWALKDHEGRALPTVWLETIPRSRDICVVGDNDEKLVHGTAWGKPILPSGFTSTRTVIHNVQAPRIRFDTGENKAFVLLHLANYSPEQRLSVNRQKLAARGFVEMDDAFEDIAKRDTSSQSDFTIVRLVNEIAQILRRDLSNEEPVLSPDRIRFAGDGTIEFGSEGAEIAFTGMLDNQAGFLDTAFRTVEASLPNEIGRSEELVSIDGERMDEETLRQKMVDAPDQMDQYGDPVFRKELIRALLAQGRWKEAHDLIPPDGGPGQDGWYHILFARHYDRAGQTDKALKHWKSFAATRPSHHEAIAALFPHEPFRSLGKQVRGFRLDTIFDVGANIGQSSVEFARMFPGATIHAFEPVPAAFAELGARTVEYKNVTRHNLALGDTNGHLIMSAHGASTMNRVQNVAGGVQVTATRVDEFCKSHGIATIDFLKIDTEGYDLNVLRGCGDFIQNISYIQCEASANNYNRFHNSYIDIYEHLTRAGFYLFLIHGQTHEWGNGGYPVLRRFDAVFINSRVVGDMENVVRK